MNKQIYVMLKGRIGNQLFIYAFAREIQKKVGLETEIIIDDTEVLSMNWENSLVHYNLPNIRFVHDGNVRKSKKWVFKLFLLRLAQKLSSVGNDFNKKFHVEKILRPFLNIFGVLLCENGYIDFSFGKKRNYFLCGYFQSTKYFKDVNEEIRDLFSLKERIESYPNLELLKNSNSICITVKVEHNVGSSLYAVCGKEYWTEAINYMVSKVQNPLFFICSDDVDYVRENLIDCNKYKVVFQDRNLPVHETLATMAQCKHFIIGNSSYSWWAQYLCTNPKKITVAPNLWMLVDMPIDLYSPDWYLIDVKPYLSAGAF